MRARAGLVIILISVFGSGLFAQVPSRSKRLPAKLLSAKSAYFDDQTGFDATGADARRELQRWGHFQLVPRRDDADVVLVLSSEYDISIPGEPAHGTFEPESLHLPHRPANAYLAVVDPVTNERLWSDSRPWGGLLTGFNSAGRRLVGKLRKRMQKQQSNSSNPVLVPR